MTNIFQTGILFETNKFHHGVTPFSGGSGQLSTFPLPHLALRTTVSFIDMHYEAESSRIRENR